MSDSKKQNIIVIARVIETLRGANFKVQLPDKNKTVIQAHTCGKMKQSKVRIVVGDEVEVEITPYDRTRGRIMRRCKIKKNNEADSNASKSQGEPDASKDSVITPQTQS